MESVKKIVSHPSICLLPVAFLMLTSKSHIFVALIMYFFCISMLRNKDKYNIQTKKTPVIFLLSIAISGILGLGFYRRWSVSLALDGFLSRFGIQNTELFCLCISILFSVLSVWGVGVLIHFYCFLGKRNKDKYGNQSAGINDTKVEVGDVLLAVGMALFVGLFLTFRPFSNYNLQTDESVFMYIGKQMVNGLVPYKDLFDHKGILLYFFNYIGFLLSDESYWGIWLVCILNAFAYALIQIKILKMITNSKTIIFLSEFAVIALFAVRCDRAANLTEGYALPWISLALYICLKYFVRKSYKINEIILLGISFAVVFFLRCNMVGVFVLLPIILIIMIIHKKGIEILKCIASFIIGLLLICIPLLVYFVKTDSLSYMIRYYLEFNFIYAKESASLATIFFVMASLAEHLVIPFTILLSFPFFCRNRVYILNLVALIVSLVLASMSGRNYPHYAVVMLPMCAVLLCYFMQIIKSEIPDKVGSIKMYQLLNVAAALLVILAVCVKNPITTAGYTSADAADEYILTNTSENDDVLIIGNDVSRYLYTDRYTSNRFFYQVPPANISEVIYQDFLNEFEKKQSDFLIFINVSRFEKEETNMSTFWKYVNSLETYERYNYEGFCVFRRHQVLDSAT